jgi:hypothetical protein
MKIIKKCNKNIAITLALILSVPLLHAQSLKPPSILPPVIAQVEAGQYLPQLEKLQQLLKEKKHLEFYEESKKTFERAYEDDGRKLKFLKDNKPTKEELVALEWVYYYRLITPLLSHEQLEGNKKMYYNEDFLSKMNACEWFCKERTSEIAGIFGVEEKKLLKHRIEVITATLAFLNKLSIYAGDVKIHEKEDASLWNEAITDGKDGTVSQSEFFDNPSPEYYDLMYKQSSRQERRSMMKTSIKSSLSIWQSDYIRKLVAYFPKQQKTIQGYLRKAGLGSDGFYPEEFHFAVMFRNAVGRKPEMEWLFKGLPSEEKIAALEQRKIREGRERAARLVEESKRLEKKKAEELAKKQAEEARREAEAARRAAAQVNPATPPSPQ